MTTYQYRIKEKNLGFGVTRYSPQKCDSDFWIFNWFCWEPTEKTWTPARNWVGISFTTREDAEKYLKDYITKNEIAPK